MVYCGKRIYFVCLNISYAFAPLYKMLFSSSHSHCFTRVANTFLFSERTNARPSQQISRTNHVVRYTLF